MLSQTGYERLPLRTRDEEAKKTFRPQGPNMTTLNPSRVGWVLPLFIRRFRLRLVMDRPLAGPYSTDLPRS
jgi:hypothetical protein